MTILDLGPLYIGLDPVPVPFQLHKVTDRAGKGVTLTLEVHRLVVGLELPRRA